MKRAIITIILLVIASLSIKAQNYAVTYDGKKVILNEDGTWQLVQEVPQELATTSYDCSALITSKTDKMTGETTVLAKDGVIVSEDGGKTGFGFAFVNIKSGRKPTTVLSITAIGAGNCIDDDDKMNVLFRDGTRLEVINNVDFNCDANFTVYFRGIFGNEYQLELFKTKEIETMRVWTSDGYVERDFTPEQSMKFMKTIDCLSQN